MADKSMFCHWSFNLRLIFAAMVFCFGLAGSAEADPKFQRWVAGFKKTAAKNGITSKTFNASFRGVTSPDPEVIRLTRFQPEFVAKVWHYLDSRVNDRTIATGKEMKRKHAVLLAKIERKYGVDRHIILAIWSMESSYGEALKKPKSLRSVIRSLATLAYADKRRRRFGRTQLIHAMKIVQRGHVRPSGLVGSWAGAMGHTQFIPSSYNAFAVDMNGDGRKDIWNSVPDALATAANLLKKNGWRSGKTWGYEVKIPRGLSKGHTNKSRTLAQWQKLGVRRVNGKAFPRPGEKGVLKLFAGKGGPAFLMTRNFYILKRYNNADKYALGVGHLADRIAGHRPIQKKWPRKFLPLNEQETMEVQRRLAKAGLYDGEIDGKVGSGSRHAIKIMQEKVGMKPDGYPSKKFLKRIRKR